MINRSSIIFLFFALVAIYTGNDIRTSSIIDGTVGFGVSTFLFIGGVIFIILALFTEWYGNDTR